MAKLRQPAITPRPHEVRLTISVANLGPDAAQSVIAQLERVRGWRKTMSPEGQETVSLRYKYRPKLAAELMGYASRLMVGAQAQAFEVWICEIPLREDPGPSNLGRLLAVVWSNDLVLEALSTPNGKKIVVEFKGEPSSAMIQLVRSQLTPYAV